MRRRGAEEHRKLFSKEKRRRRSTHWLKSAIVTNSPSITTRPLSWMPSSAADRPVLKSGCVRKAATKSSKKPNPLPPKNRKSDGKRENAKKHLPEAARRFGFIRTA